MYVKIIWFGKIINWEQQCIYKDDLPQLLSPCIQYRKRFCVQNASHIHNLVFKSQKPWSEQLFWQTEIHKKNNTSQ